MAARERTSRCASRGSTREAVTRGDVARRRLARPRSSTAGSSPSARWTSSTPRSASSSRARCRTTPPDARAVQNELFDLGADLSVPGEVEGRLRIEQPLVDRLEEDCDRFNADLPELRSFVLPGEAPTAAAGLHVARTICRRAEREALVAAQEHRLGPLVARLPQPALRPPLHPRARGERERRPRRAALEAGRDSQADASAGGLRDRLAARRDVVRRPRRAHRLLPGRSTSSAAVARRAGVLRARRRHEPPAGPVVEPARDRDRSAPRGSVGALAAWLGFTLPSAVAMTVLALVVGSADVSGAGWVRGLQLVAVPVVLLAVLAMRGVARAGSRTARVAAVAALLALGSAASSARPPRCCSGRRRDRSPSRLTSPGRGSPCASAARRPSASRASAALASLLVGLPGSATRPARRRRPRRRDGAVGVARVRRRPRRAAAPRPGRRRARVG